MPRALWVLLSAAALSSAGAQLVAQTWPSVAFSPQSGANETRVPGLNFTAAGDFPPLCSVRFSGTISDSTASELLNFSAVSDGGVRLWIDDHLVIDAGGNFTGAPRTVRSFLGIPVAQGVPLPFRLEYSRWGSGGPATLQLWWSGNVTARSVVPDAAYSPTVSNSLVERTALRDRLEAPDCAWQTYAFASMGAHVMMPAGIALFATLAVAGTNTTLGNVAPYRNGRPALVRPGLHSMNGSDYTQLTVSRWTPAHNASVSFETTVDGATGGLRFLATCEGSDCTGLLLVVEPQAMSERAASFSYCNSSSNVICAAAPGFPPVVATALGAVSVPWGGAPQPLLALPLGVGPVGYFTGVGPAPTIAEVQASLVAAVARVLTAEAPYGDLAPLWEPAATVIAWNTIFTPYEGVVTPVSRLWDIWHEGYMLFEWDTYFVALMASLQAGIAKDIAYANLLQVTLGRTLMGFVPNGSAGPKKSFDRSEPPVGALVVKHVFDKWGDAWLIDALLPSLLSWNDWEWNHRRGEGSLAGPDGHADLLVLGSDPSSPPSDTQNNLQAARYEGMDNSPLYDAPPASFNASVTHHMNIYDVGATALFLSETEALIALCEAAAGSCDAVSTLQARFARVQTALNTHLWDAGAGVYSNALFNGSLIPRTSPTTFFPLLSASATDAQALALVAELTSPAGFCYNSSHSPAPNADMVVQWSSRGGRTAACVTINCTRAAIDAGYGFERVEAVALLPAGGPGPGLEALSLYVDATTGASALVAGTPPPPPFELVRQEGWCWAAPPALPSGWPTTPLTLWHSGTLGEYRTCGTAACANASAPGNFTLVRTMCWAFNGTGPMNTPCKVGGPSIARSDAAFLDQDYWRGRTWGPHHQLMYWGLARYDHLPAAHAARADLVAMGAELVRFNWEGFSVVCENVNGLTGVCEDSGDADPFYTWGALFGFTGLIEGGYY